ncbi:hypothetical protein L7F22_010944 [Adiantum nelumboides]|nr:hypothetical protein [Adiantum nelumboides]
MVTIKQEIWMCGAYECGSLTKERCMLERPVEDEACILELFPEHLFEPFGWTQVLATLDVCVNELTPIKFCDEEGYDLVSCVMMEVLRNANENCEHESRGTNSYVIMDATQTRPRRVIQPCKEAIIDITEESTITAPKICIKKEANMKVPEEAVVSSSTTTDVQPSEDQKNKKEQDKVQSLPTLIKFSLCDETGLKVTCSASIDPYATKNIMSYGTWIMMGKPTITELEDTVHTSVEMPIPSFGVAEAILKLSHGEFKDTFSIVDCHHIKVSLVLTKSWWKNFFFGQKQKASSTTTGMAQETSTNNAMDPKTKVFVAKATWQQPSRPGGRHVDRLRCNQEEQNEGLHFDTTSDACFAPSFVAVPLPSPGVMETFYIALFVALVLFLGAVELGKSKKDRIVTNAAFSSFKNNYLVVYCLMMAGDWLQGPYVYFLYTKYGFGKGDIGRLFIAGFGSSMIFGTCVGSLADKYGRKRAGITYCLTYILSCLTKHSPQYKVLMLGRILGGIATSLLFSAFESWLVAEHFKRGFESQWLSLTFSKAVFLGNGLIAILAGLLANFLADTLALGPVSPFDAASCVLALGMAIIMYTWAENYGDNSEGRSLLIQFKGAASAIASDEKIFLLGAIQSLFEGSMYTFVFLWTPALSPDEEDIPHGFIFATFMLSSMIGSSLTSRFMARTTLRVESYLQIVFLVSSAALFSPVAINFLMKSTGHKGGSLTASGRLLHFAFCVFEACVGIFWPSIMKLRSQFVPEESRSTILNFFRIPVNVFVCLVLYNVDAFPITVMFGMCSLFLLLASVLQNRLKLAIEKPKTKTLENWPSEAVSDAEMEPLNV